MEQNMTRYPFEAPFDQILKDSERYVDAVFSSLESEFLIMPKGIGFVEYPVFERGYEALKAATKGFSQLHPTKVLSVDSGRTHLHCGVTNDAGFYASGMGLCDHPTKWNQCHTGIRPLVG